MKLAGIKQKPPVKIYVGMEEYKMQSSKSKYHNYPLEYAIDIIGGKWKPRIIWSLGDNTLRFGELEKLVPDPSRKTLIQQLKELEADQIIQRTVYPQIPPKVEYSLTNRGMMLLPVLSVLKRWGMEHIKLLDNGQQEMV